MPETTQRAYTLRLQGHDPKDASWREALWKTHEAVNRGAKAFGDWLLTLRGGLDHSLADEGAPGQTPTEEQRKQRRILLALSWLSVESENGAPQEYIVPHDRDNESGARQNWKTREALREILKNRGCRDDEIESWCHDCEPSLTSAIRKDAVWVNRSKAFDNAVQSIPNFSREEIWDLLGCFFVSSQAYLAPLESPKDDKPDASKKDSSKDLIQSAGQWLSRRFGRGKGLNFARLAETYEAIARWASVANPGDTNDLIADLAKTLNAETPELDGILKVVSGPGHKSKTRNLLRSLSAVNHITKDTLQRLKDTANEDAKKAKLKKGEKGHRAYAYKVLEAVEDACGFTYLQEGDRAKHCEFAVMLDHAARRVSSLHTWIKRAEAERRRFEIDTKKKDQLPPSVKEWLDTYCQKRSKETGAVEPYRIRRGAIEGWKEIVEAWSKAGTTTAEDRKHEARRLPDNPHIDKSGDIKLFEDLALEDALPVWHANGDPNNPPDPQLLIDYVEGSEAEFKKRAFKVPTYCHPDPLVHPVFCDYGCSRWNVSFAIQPVKKQKLSSEEKLPAKGLLLDLLHGTAIRPVALRWQSKRFARDLALNTTDSSDKPNEVTRADRFGCALAKCPSSQKIRIRGLFEEKYWNGRLQAPRPELTALAKRVAKYGWDKKARKLRNSLNWFITFSANLRPSGPWEEYTKYAEKAFSSNASAKPSVSRGGFWVVHASPNKRGKMAQLRLCRLPELRVLSVDLGHRYAAACAVWETLSKSAFEQEIHERKILRGGTGPNDLFCHTQHDTNGQSKVTIYRRIGADTLPNGTPHPAPWARLDRQFLIKLPGEEREARKASPTELANVEKLEKELGLKTSENRVKRIDDLMSDTLRTVRQALRRHSLRARIAFNLATLRDQSDGDEESQSKQKRDTRWNNTVKIWHSLLESNEWTDDWAKALWDELGPLSDPQKADDAEWLKLAAEKFYTRWQEDEQTWRERLRWLRRWILPRGSQAASQKGSIRHVGGLSLTRLATIKTLYQVLKAYHMRLKPDNSRKNIPAEGDEALQNFGQKILDDLEHMREQRVKQLASRIVEAALGLGRMKQVTIGKDPKRPREPVDQSCHAVVIENLTHYRPEKRQTRRENRQLMDWSAAKVKKYLKECCQLHGLHLVEVSASYTSRQDSRTGAPGIRCQEVPLTDFLKKNFWREQVKQAKQRLSEGKANARDRYLCQLNERWGNAPAPVTQTAIRLRIPLNGGELFVSADQNSPASKGIQADLNAAANIGLRAITDPDWPGAWWYVPCEANTFKPVKDKVAGSAAIDSNVSLKKDSPNSEKPASDRKSRTSKSMINLWCDTSSKSLSEKDQWQESAPYWEDVAARTINILQASLACSTTNSQ